MKLEGKTVYAKIKEDVIKVRVLTGLKGFGTRQAGKKRRKTTRLDSHVTAHFE